MAPVNHAHDYQKTKTDTTSDTVKAASPRRTYDRNALTHIPKWASLAYGNEVPPSLHLPIQGKLEAAQTMQQPTPTTSTKENTTGLSDTLKAGIETLSGLSMDDVQVHYNSPQPAQVQALAYTQGTDIHVGPGQEKYLPHEAWHAVQQKQGRVQPTMQAKGMVMNDDEGLEREADVMGGRAASPHGRVEGNKASLADTSLPYKGANPIQRVVLNIQEQKLTKPMLELWMEISTAFEKSVIASSPLASGPLNQVVLWGVSQGSIGMKDYAATTFYIAKDTYKGCKEGDHEHFTEIWSYPGADILKLSRDVAVRIVIAVNLTLHKSPEELYATLLHEWFLHAAKWEGVVEAIRSDKAGHALPWVQGQGYEKRAQGEHIQYAKLTDKEISAL